MGTENTERGLAAKHIVWLVLAIATLASIVLLSIFAEGAHVEAVIAFAIGLLIPGSPAGGLARRAAPAAALLLAVAIAIPAQGCGSVIGTQARIATAGLVTVEGIQRFADTNHESAIAACASASDRIACIDAADAEWIPVGEGADGAGVAIVGWIGTLEVARLADGDVDEALSMAMARALDVIRPAFVLALCRDAPIPPWLLQAIGIDPETACEEG